MLYLRPEQSSEKYADWVEVDGDKLALEGTYITVPPAAPEAHSSADSSSKHDNDQDMQ